MSEEISQVPNQPTSTNTPTPKKSNRTQLLLIGILGIVLIITIGVVAYLWGNGAFTNEKSAETNQATTPKTKVIGEEFTANSGVTIVLEEAKLDSSFEKKKKDYQDYLAKIATQSSQPLEKPEWLDQNKLDLEIAFKNKNEIAASYNPARFRLKDGEDRQYQAEFKGDPLTIYGVNQGETTRVNVYFTVPKSEKNFKLIYEDVIIEFGI